MINHIEFILVYIIVIVLYMINAATYEAIGSHTIASDFNIDLVDVNTTSLANGYDVSTFDKPLDYESIHKSTNICAPSIRLYVNLYDLNT